MLINIVFLVLAAVVLSTVGAMAAGGRLDLGGPVRDWMLRRAASRLARNPKPPETVERTYWRAIDYERDCQRLEFIGYVVDYESANDPYVAYDIPGRYGRARPTRRRVPMYHVTYRAIRSSAGASPPRARG